MILGLGNDICNIDRIAEAFEHFGQHFVDKCYGSDEKKELSSALIRKQYMEGLAKRFAAKEAFVKALGCGFRNGIKWAEIEVLHEDNGKPYIQLSGVALNFFNAMGAQKVFVALSDDHPFTMATVIIED